MQTWLSSVVRTTPQARQRRANVTTEAGAISIRPRRRRRGLSMGVAAGLFSPAGVLALATAWVARVVRHGHPIAAEGAHLQDAR